MKKNNKNLKSEHCRLIRGLLIFVFPFVLGCMLYFVFLCLDFVNVPKEVKDKIGGKVTFSNYSTQIKLLQRSYWYPVGQYAQLLRNSGETNMVDCADALRTCFEYLYKRSEFYRASKFFVYFVEDGDGNTERKSGIIFQDPLGNWKGDFPEN